MIKIIITIILFSCVSMASDEVYFSPRGGCEKVVTKLIDSSKQHIDIAVYSLNNTEIISALKNAKKRDVKIRILTDRTQASINQKQTLDFVHLGFDIKIHSSEKIMHNKFGIFDHKKVITGSFNWTNPAERVNAENCVVLDNLETIKKFDEQFDGHLWVVNTETKSKIAILKMEKKAKRVATEKEGI